MSAIVKIHGGHGQVSEGHHETQRFANSYYAGDCGCGFLTLRDSAGLGLSEEKRVLPCPDNLEALASHCKRYVNREVGSLATPRVSLGKGVIAVKLCGAPG